MPAPVPLSHTERWRAFWVAVAVGATTILDLTKVNVALPSMETSLGASASELQLIVSGYVLTFGLALVPMGRLGDQRSRRTLFTVGLVLFAATSAICAMAPNTTVLLIARLAQGVAAGIQMPQVVGTIQYVFHGPERGKAFGLFGAVIGVSTAFGPTLGGLFIALGGAADGWRWVFWMNVPLCLALLAAVRWLMPDTRTDTDAPLHLDPVGMGLLGVTVVALMWPFLTTTGSGNDDPRRWWLLAVAGIVGAAFAWWERRYAAEGKAPVLPLSLFSIPSFRHGTLVVTAYFAAIPSMFLLTTLFLQLGLGTEPVYAGMVSIGFALVSAVAAWRGGTLVGRLGRPLVVAGLVVVLVSIGVLGWAAHTVLAGRVEWVMAAILALAGLGGGLVVAPNQALTLARVPASEGGLAGSVGHLGQRIGTAVGTAVTLSLFYAKVAAEDSAAPLVAYQDAYRLAMIAVAGFVGLALVFAVADLRTSPGTSRTKTVEAKP